MMVVEPTARAVTFPSVTVAMLVLDDDHVTVLYVALSGDIVADSSTVSPAWNVMDVMLSLIEETATSVGFLLQAALMVSNNNRIEKTEKKGLDLQTFNLYSFIEIMMFNVN